MTVELHIFSGMTFAKYRFVYRNSFVGLLQVFEGNYFMMLEATHKLMRRVAVWAQKIGAIRTTRHGALFGLAGGTQYCHVLDSGHVQYIGENVVACERRGALRTNGSLLMAYGTVYDRANLGVPGLVHEQLVQAGLAEHVEAGEYPGRAQLAHTQGAALIVGLAVPARYLLQGIAGIAAVVAAPDGVALLAEYVAAVELLGASRGDDAAVRRGRRRHRRGPGRNNGHRGRCHPAILRSGGMGGESRSRRPPTVLISGARGYRSSREKCASLLLFFSSSFSFFPSTLCRLCTRLRREREQRAERDGEDSLGSSSHEAGDPRNIVLSRSLATREKQNTG